MNITLLKSKIHRAVVTDADLNYEGSISIDPDLCEKAGLLKFEKVEIYNCNNGARFATYVIHGKKDEICLNGAAARHVQKGDLVIICSYCSMDHETAKNHEATLVMIEGNNQIKEINIATSI